MFDAPLAGTGDVCKPADIVNHLLIIAAKGHRADVVTAFGTSDAIAVDVADLDTGAIYREALWFNKALVGGLKQKVGGSPVLARMGQGTAKAGQSPPFILIDATTDAAAVAKAEAFLGDHPDFLGQFAPPVQPKPHHQPEHTPAVSGQLDLSTLPPEVQALLAKQQATA